MVAELEPQEGLAGGGSIIVMTDLFVSMSAALLIVLAVAEDTPPTPLPVQADLVALCPHEAAGPFRIMTPAQAMQTASRPIPAAIGTAEALGIEVSSAGDVDGIADLPDLFPALVYTVALVGDETHLLTAGCAVRFGRDIVDPHNNIVASQPDGNTIRSILAVVPTRPTEAEAQR